MLSSFKSLKKVGYDFDTQATLSMIISEEARQAAIAPAIEMR